MLAPGEERRLSNIATTEQKYGLACLYYSGFNE